jgi:hypothetical protein
MINTRTPLLEFFFQSVCDMKQDSSILRKTMETPDLFSHEVHTYVHFPTDVPELDIVYRNFKH